MVKPFSLVRVNFVIQAGIRPLSINSTTRLIILTGLSNIKKNWVYKMSLLAIANQYSTAGKVIWIFLVSTIIVITSQSCLLRFFCHASVCPLSVSRAWCLLPTKKMTSKQNMRWLHIGKFFPITMINDFTLPSQFPENSQCLISLSQYSRKLTSWPSYWQMVRHQKSKYIYGSFFHKLAVGGNMFSEWNFLHTNGIRLDWGWIDIGHVV